MARNIFNQPPRDDDSEPAAAPAPSRAAKLPGSVGGLRDSLREITANSIRDLEPEQIDMDGVRDRLEVEDGSLDDLAASIRKHGQQVPILVRPSDRPGRYRIVYGRRRLAAIRRLGVPVKAIVRVLDDDATLIAQGQENSQRLDPSFIEKALFIREMQAAGYAPGVVQDALGLTRQGVSNHRVVLEKLPDEAIRLIGPAHGIGRRQWAELAAFAETLPLVDLARETLATLPEDTASPERFQAVHAACSAQGRTRSRNRAKRGGAAHGRPVVVEDADGTPVATLTIDGKAIGIRVLRRDNPDFGQWLETHAETELRRIFKRWRSGQGATQGSGSG